MMYWKNAINRLVVRAIVFIGPALVADSYPTRGVNYLPQDHGSTADSWLRGGSESADKYFNLRLYWEKGFRWQDKVSEKFWCIECTRSSCSKGSAIRIGKCDRNDSRQQFYYDDGRIRSRKNKSLCFQRKGRRIVLNSCSGSVSQKWDKLSKTDAYQLKSPGNDVFCASQHHHPKDEETVYMTSCKKSRANKTDKWIAY